MREGGCRRGGGWGERGWAGKVLFLRGPLLGKEPSSPHAPSPFAGPRAPSAGSELEKESMKKNKFNTWRSAINSP